MHVGRLFYCDSCWRYNLSLSRDLLKSQHIWRHFLAIYLLCGCKAHIDLLISIELLSKQQRLLHQHWVVFAVILAGVPLLLQDINRCRSTLRINRSSILAQSQVEILHVCIATYVVEVRPVRQLLILATHSTSLMRLRVLIYEVLREVILVRQLLLAWLARTFILALNLEDSLQLLVSLALTVKVDLLGNAVEHTNLLSHVHALIDILVNMLARVTWNSGLFW